MGFDGVTVSGSKNRISKGFVVVVNGQQLNRFESWTISRSLDVVPMSFSLTYAYEQGEAESIFSKVGKSSSSGVLAVGSRVEFYLDGLKLFTGYVDSTDEGVEHGNHMLYVSGRSLAQVVVDGTTIKPAGQIPTAVTTLSQLAQYMVTNDNGDKLVEIIDKTGGDTPHPLVGLGQIDLTTRTYDYLAMMAQYEGKIIYDDQYGRLVIDSVASGSSTTIGFQDKLVKRLFRHQSNLGRFQKYQVIVNAYGGQAGVNNSVFAIPPVSDPTPSQIPNGRILTFVSQASYPTDGNTNGLIEFQTALAHVTANRNWGRGDVITATLAGHKNPTTNKPWELNSLLKIDFSQQASAPQMSEEYVISDIQFVLDRGTKETSLTLVRKESLQVEPLTITPPIAGVNNATTQGIDSPATKQGNGQLPLTDQPPTNAKPQGGK